MSRVHHSAVARHGCHAGTPPLAVVLLGSLLLSGLGQASDLTECMTDRMQQADDNMTIGELRLQCQKQLHSGE